MIISSPVEVNDEAEIINSLFEEGMQMFHIRKPGAVISEVDMFIKKIKPAFYNKLVLHQHHVIAGNYGIKRLHFKEEAREKLEARDYSLLRTSGYSLSTSIHSMQAYHNLSPFFEYAFLGPVFNSISKPGYKGAWADCILPENKKGPKIVAIGGIDETNMEKAMDMKFDGVAILGAIWQRPEEGVKQFKLLQEVWKVSGP